MGDYKIKYFSPDERIRAEGFVFKDVIKNSELFQRIMEYIHYIRLGNFRLIPGHIAHRDRYYEDTKDVHYLYVREDLDIENSEEGDLEKEVSEKVLEPVS